MPGKSEGFAGHFSLVRRPRLTNEKNRQTRRQTIFQTMYYANFFASSKNLANPISVKGCFNNPRIESSGHVQTSAPASAHLIMCKGLRMDAASISVL